MRPWTCLKKRISFSDRQEQILKTKLLKFGLNFLLPDREKIHLLPGKSRVEIKILLCVPQRLAVDLGLGFLKEFLRGPLSPLLYL
jgi:hypothetical protein